jgi:electron transfer flavoprotein alpha subunit
MDSKHVLRLAAEHGVSLSSDDGSVHMRQDDDQVTVARFLIGGELMAAIEVSAPVRFAKDAAAILDSYATALSANLDRPMPKPALPKKPGPKRVDASV